MRFHSARDVISGIKELCLQEPTAPLARPDAYLCKRIVTGGRTMSEGREGANRDENEGGEGERERKELGYPPHYGRSI